MRRSELGAHRRGVAGGPLIGGAIPRLTWLTCRRGRGLRWGVIGGVLALQAGAAQMPSPPVAPVAGRLSVRPRAMATGTRTAQAGDQELAVGNGKTAKVYVPPQCVGARRCPLVLCMAFFPRELADQYGMILLNPNFSGNYHDFGSGMVSVDPGVPYLVRETQGGSYSAEQFVRLVDTMLTRMLRDYAIDPEKIAVSGNSWDGAWTIILGRTNPDVFSRIVPRAPGTDLPFDGPTPTIATTQFSFVGGVADLNMFASAMNVALATRRDGYPVRLVLVPQGHIGSSGPDVPAMFRWFHESWAAPAQARRAAEPRPPAPGPLLTADALARWTTFWTRFMAEPDSIREVARRAHIKEIPTLVGREPVTLVMMDLPTLAAQYPSVAADLQAAGLTAPEAEAYRTALLSAWATFELQYQQQQRDWHWDEVAAALVVAPTSVLGRNLAFLAARPEIIKLLRGKELASDNLWTTVP